MLLIGNGSDHVFPFKQSSLHDLLSFDIDLKSFYHRIGVRCGLHACLVKSFGLANAFNVFILNHILHSFMGKFVNICFDDILTFINIWESSLALVEFDCIHLNYVTEFSSCVVGCDLLISLTPLRDFECVNVNGKGRVDYVL